MPEAKAQTPDILPDVDMVTVTDVDGIEQEVKIKTRLPTIKKLEILDKTANVGLLGTPGFMRNWKAWHRGILNEVVLTPPDYVGKYAKFEELYDEEYEKVIDILNKYYNLADFLNKSAKLIQPRQ